LNLAVHAPPLDAALRLPFSGRHEPDPYLRPQPYAFGVAAAACARHAIDARSGFSPTPAENLRQLHDHSQRTRTWVIRTALMSNEARR